MKTNTTIIGKQIALTIICILLGFAISLQFKSVRFNRSVTSENLRVAELQATLNDERSKNEALSIELDSTKAQIAELRNNSTGSDVISAQLELAEQFAGIVPLTGPGVTVVMTDAKTPIAGGTTVDSYIIHDSDLRSVINELYASGAEAVSVNGERLVSTSSVRCVGPTVLVNNTRLSIPFEITAIGDSKTLEAGLIVKGGIVDTLTPWGIDIKITRHTKVEVPAYRGFSSFKYAEPVVSADQKNVQISGGDVQ